MPSFFGLAWETSVRIFVSCLAGIAAASLVLTASAQADTALRIGVVSRTIFYLPAWTAEKRGFFKAEGLDVDIVVYDASDKILADVRVGLDQVGISSIESAVLDAYRGGPMRLVAGSAQRPPHFIVASRRSSRSTRSRARRSASSHDEGTTFFIKDIAKAGGFKLSDVKVEAVGGSPTRARLLKERKIDVGLQPYPLSYEAEQNGFTNLGPIAKLVPDYQFTSVIVDDTWARQNRPALLAFLRALRKGTDYMFSHPDESAELGAKELRTTPEFARRALDDTLRMDVMARDLSLTDLSLQKVFATMQEAGVLGHDVVYDRARFVDDTYLSDSRR